MRKILSAMVIAGFGVVGIAGAFTFARGTPSWADDCEDAFLYRIRTPASYQRVSFEMLSKDISLDEHIIRNPTFTSSMIENYRSNPPIVKDWTVIVTYDAENLFGARVRNTFFCTATTTNGVEPRGGGSEISKELFMEVNGITGQQLQLEAIRRLNSSN